MSTTARRTVDVLGVGGPHRMALQLDLVGDPDDAAIAQAVAEQLGVAPAGLPVLPALHDGVAVVVAPGPAVTAPPAPRPSGGVEVAVVGGLHAGGCTPLRPGHEVVVGRSAAVTLPLADPEVSRAHALVAADADGATVLDPGSRNGISYRGFRLDGVARPRDGEPLLLGESALVVRPAPPRAAVVTAGDDGPAVDRAPRIVQPPPERDVAYPDAPNEQQRRRLPLIAALAPLVLAGILYLVLPSAGPYLLFLALSPVLFVATALADRRHSGADAKRDAARYRERRQAADTRVAELLVEEQRERRDADPDPAAVLSAVLLPTTRLWERRLDDVDALRLRFGLGDLPARLAVRTGRGKDDDEPVPEPVVTGVPIAVDLRTAGVAGLAGPRATQLAWARAAVCHLAALHPPEDVGLVVLTGRDEAADWEWATWLPHTRPGSGDPDAPARLVAAGAEQAEARVVALRRLVGHRQDAQRSRLDEAVAGRRYVVVVDGARRMRGLRGLSSLLAGGPAAGVVFVCLDDDPAALPAECRVTALVGAGGTRATVRTPGGSVQDVLLDGLSVADAERCATALAPLRLLGSRDVDDEGVPTSVRLLDELGAAEPDGEHRPEGGDPVGSPTPDRVTAGWARAAATGTATRLLLGRGVDGPVHVDLRRDGPHALVAGTSGAGKSELLQTLVAGLVLANPPEDLSLVLVDYKGGAAFRDCARLPHCAGLVTDLDGNLADRVLASLRAELGRRERVLAAAGATDAEELRARGGSLARLVVVVDEFATLVEEVPEFVDGMVGIGMRGRSLGVHIVLATQRPGGVVSADIRANVNLRICLRVTRPEESTDVVDVPDGAALSRHTPGRALVRTGAGDLVTVQTARVGGAAPGPDQSAGRPTVTARRRSLAGLGLPARLLAAGPATPATDGPEVTDLSVVVDAVVAACEGHEPARPPWLPPLPAVVAAPDLVAAEPVPAPGLVARIGLADLPSEQDQRPHDVDLAAVGALLVVGAVRSGRSTALRAIAGSLASDLGPADLHLYGLDFGNRALAPLQALPHTGAVVPGEDLDRVERLLHLLTDQVVRRRRSLAAGGHADIAEQRAAAPAGHALPWTVLLLDRLDAFTGAFAERDGGRLVDELERLLRDGPAVGVHVVAATDRTGLSHRIGSAVEHRLLLRQAERDDWAVLGIDHRTVPGAMPPGRGLLVPGGTEVQVALLDADPGGPAQTRALVDLGSRWPHDGPRGPAHVDALPDSIGLAEALALPDGGDPPDDAAPPAPGRVLAGVGGDRLSRTEVELGPDVPGLLVVGPPRSGRTSALAVLATTLAGRADGRLAVLLVTPRRSALAELAELPGVVGVVGPGPQTEPELVEALDALSSRGPLAVLVDDAELLADGLAGAALERFAAVGRDAGSLLIAATTTEDLLVHRFRGWLSSVRRARTGLLLSPSGSADGEALEVRLPRSTGHGWPPGRAVLVADGDVRTVQVPLPGQATWTNRAR